MSEMVEHKFCNSPQMCDCECEVCRNAYRGAGMPQPPEGKWRIAHDEANASIAGTLNSLAAEAHRIAVEHGFTDNTIGEDMALIHSEVSEALEDHRNGHKPTETWYEAKTSIESKTPIDKPCGIPSEMADIVIRVAHFCAKHGIDLDKAVAEKMEYNATRPYKHGKVM